MRAYRCGDPLCWCAHATGLVVATKRKKKRDDSDAEAPDDATPLHLRPNHRGYMLNLEHAGVRS